MSDLSSMLPGVNRSFRISDVAAKNLNDCLVQYADEDFQWELIVAPIQTPQGMNFGLLFILSMPTPTPDPMERFLVSGQYPTMMMFHDVSTVRQVVHDLVEALRKMRSDWLKGAN